MVYTHTYGTTLSLTTTFLTATPAAAALSTIGPMWIPGSGSHLPIQYCMYHNRRATTFNPVTKRCCMSRRFPVTFCDCFMSLQVARSPDLAASPGGEKRRPLSHRSVRPLHTTLVKHGVIDTVNYSTLFCLVNAIEIVREGASDHDRAPR